MLSTELYAVSLLVLFSLWDGGLSLPVTSKEPVSEKCVSYAQTLLESISDTLNQNNLTLHENLFKGIDCRKESVELNPETDTPSVCAPHVPGTNCSGVSKPQFNQELCVQSIGEDLRHFYTFLSAHPDPDRSLSSTVLGLRQFMRNCFSWTLPEGLNESLVERQSSFDERLSLCKKMKGFQIRSVTISRALGYMRCQGLSQ